MKNKQQYCLNPQTLINLPKFLENLKKDQAYFIKFSNFNATFQILNKNQSPHEETIKFLINDFLKEIQNFITTIKITDIEQANYQEFYEAISLIHAFVYLKKVYLNENILIDWQFSSIIYMIFFLKLFRKSQDKKNRHFSEKDIQKKFLDTMYIFSRNYLDLSSSDKNQFFSVNTNSLAVRHQNNVFFDSLSTKLSDESNENFIVLENIALILFSKLLKTMSFNEEFTNEKMKTELFLNNFLVSSLKICSNLIELTLKSQEVNIIFVQNLLNNILKTIVTTLSVKNLEEILFEKLKDNGFKEIKFIMKLYFIILFEDVDFEKFETFQQEIDSFQPNAQQIKTLNKVGHLNSKEEKIKVFNRLQQVK